LIRPLPSIRPNCPGICFFEEGHNTRNLRSELEDASQQVVQVQIATYGNADSPFTEIFPHASSNGITEYYGEHGLIVNADGRKILAGILSPETGSRAASTMPPGLVIPITEVIAHNLYITEL